MNADQIQRTAEGDTGQVGHRLQGAELTGVVRPPDFLAEPLGHLHLANQRGHRRELRGRFALLLALTDHLAARGCGQG